jgi:hypothetical protein
MSKWDFECHIAEMPEPKLELLDGKLVVGNGAGNLRLLYHLLEGWGAEAALPMAPADRWWKALHAGFRSFDPPSPDKPAAVWQAWASQVTYAADLPPAGPMVNGKHSAARERLTMGLYRCGVVEVASRDVVMRLGEDAFTPDVWVVGAERQALVNDHYLDGPADLVIEVLLRGHARYDLVVKRQQYAAGGVGEYWLVDPVRSSIEFLRLSGGEYRFFPLGQDGVYRPAAFPHLAFRPAFLWERDSWGRGPNPFTVEGSMPAVSHKFAKGAVQWGDLPFDPQPDLEPVRLSFAQFAAWTPEAKFECIEGKPWVGGSIGARNVLGMLLRTEGLAKAVTVLHPAEWVKALMRAEENRQTDAERKRQGWQVARRAADFLRERYGCGRIVVIGDLVDPSPWNVWSLIHLVVMDPSKKCDAWDVYRQLREQFPGEDRIDLSNYEYLTRSEKEAVAAEGVDV